MDFLLDPVGKLVEISGMSSVCYPDHDYYNGINAQFDIAHWTESCGMAPKTSRDIEQDQASQQGQQPQVKPRCQHHMHLCPAIRDLRTQATLIHCIASPKPQQVQLSGNRSRTAND
jgi:hypothetical protein